MSSRQPRTLQLEELLLDGGDRVAAGGGGTVER